MNLFVNFIKCIKKIFTKQKIHPDTHSISNAVSNAVSNKQLLLIWSSSNPTYGPYHWWPWKSLEHTNTDTYTCNNLYAKGSALDKYDHLFCAKSVEYQKKHYFREFNSTLPDKDWAGFCDKASMLSCLWEYPKYSVRVQYNGKVVKFTLKDIEALMIIVSENTITTRQSFYGERYNGHYLDDTSEPYPTKLLSLLRIICSEHTPFCVDVSNNSSVWNYPMSNVNVTKYTQKPTELNTQQCCIPKVGQTNYYHFLISSHAYPTKTQNIWGWVNHTNGHKTEGWISKKTPDFLWRTYKKKRSWEKMSTINPEVSCNFVYKLYQHSLNDTKENTLLII